ncbi:MAG: hypothetical protein KJ000_04280 [Pirellulaceae bacterium]|nr:hypothetical protein [Pirellulaceae bacterium]
MTKSALSAVSALLAVLAVGLTAAKAADNPPLDYRIELTTASSGFDGETCWVHARAGAIPPGTPGNARQTPLVVMTMQKLLLTGSDVFYALHNLWTDDLGETWTKPQLQPVFERQVLGDGIESVVGHL